MPINSPTVKNDVALLRAEGMSHKKIGKFLGMHEETVANVAAKPEVRERIAELRQRYKQVAMAKLEEAVTPALDMLVESASQRDAKSFNLTAFGLGAIERVSASVSGEAQRVQVDGTAQAANPRIEIRNLLVQLFDKPAG